MQTLFLQDPAFLSILSDLCSAIPAGMTPDMIVARAETLRPVRDKTRCPECGEYHEHINQIGELASLVYAALCSTMGREPAGTPAAFLNALADELQAAAGTSPDALGHLLRYYPPDDDSGSVN